jgi:ArsR family transcriptional regulator
MKPSAKTFLALANDLRLQVFKLLIQKSPGYLPAGQIAVRLQVPGSTLSGHLARLEQAGLLRSRREQQRILYGVDPKGVNTLARFLLDDCCGGRPELCGYTRPRPGGKRRASVCEGSS